MDASSFSLTECIQSLRGPDGSSVTVQVEREESLVEITIQRRAMQL